MARTTPVVQYNTLFYFQDGRDYRLEVGIPAWFDWLDTVATFAYKSDQGSFTAHKEKAGNNRGGWYWRAYRRHEGKLYRSYLGKSEELTLERLNIVAQSLETRRGRFTAPTADLSTPTGLSDEFVKVDDRPARRSQIDRASDGESNKPNDHPTRGAINLAPTTHPHLQTCQRIFLN